MYNYPVLSEYPLLLYCQPH